MKLTTTQQMMGLDEFPVIGWSSVPASFTSLEIFKSIKDCGINVFMTTGAGGGASGPHGESGPIMAQLDLAAETGLKAIVCDRRFNPVKNPANDGWKQDVDAAIAEYDNHPAVAAFYVFDEPIIGDKSKRCGCEDIVPMIQHLRKMAPNRLAYVNALGFGSRGMNCFEEYLDSYTRIINPQFISTDCYPLTTRPDEKLFPGYFDDDCGMDVPELGSYYREAFWEGWETQLRVARGHRKPLWGFVLAVPHTHSHWFYGPVTEGTLRLEAFTALAYGAQAIQYFAMTTHTANSCYDDAILDTQGLPSIRYDLFRKVNKDLAVLGPVVSGLRVANVYYRGYVPSGGKRFRFGRYPGDQSHRPLAHVEGDGNLLLSFMDGPDGQRFCLLLNNHPARRARFQLTLETGWNLHEVIRHNGQLTKSLGVAHIANFEPGDARVFQMVPESQRASVESL